MPSSTLAEPGPLVEGRTRAPERSGTHPAVYALASAVLLWFAFPPADWGWLAWVALVPLFLLVPSRRSRSSLYFGVWAGGMAFWLLSIYWVSLTDESAWLAWVVMAFALSLWWPAFFALARLAVLRLRLPLMVAAPILWVGLEYLRAFVLSGFPWYYLAHSQHLMLPVIQIADCAGALGVSWLIALFNAWCVDLLTAPLLRPSPRGPRITRPQLVRGVTVAAVLSLTLGYGAFRMATAHFRPGPRVALLQSSLIQRLKMGADPRSIEDVYQRLVNRALNENPRPDLVVWPETSYPYFGLGTIDADVDAASLEKELKRLDLKWKPDEWREHMIMLSRHLHGWTDQAGVPMLVGSVYQVYHNAGRSKYNSAILFEPGRPEIQRYDKLHLVPFGEYVPLIDYLPWLTALTPYHGTQTPSLSFGKEPRWIELGPYRFATAICFEDTVPHVVRRFFDEAPGGRQPDAILNISNDGWFHGSSEHDMHLAVSIFRAVENRVPLARAVNTGVSALVDGNGRVLKSLPKLSEGVLSGVVPLDDRVSLYSAWGDWLGLTCLAVTIGLGPVALGKSLLRSRTA